MREMNQDEREHWRELMNKKRKTPEDILWMSAHAIVTRTIKTPHGTVRICDNFVMVQTPEELEERRRRVQTVAAALAYN